MIRALHATREAQENENKRRAAWERELEAKYRQRQAEMETQLAEMKREIAYLKASVALFGRQHPEGTVQASGSGCLLDGPGSPSLAVPPAGSSTEKSPPVPHGKEVSGNLQKHNMLLDSPSLSASSGLSNRKRPTSPLHHRESDSGDSGSEASQLSTGKRPQKRINNHDKTCYTIQVFFFHTTSYGS